MEACDARSFCCKFGTHSRYSKAAFSNQLDLTLDIASNRIGVEIAEAAEGVAECKISFYGSSFITNCTGAIVAESSQYKEEDDDDSFVQVTSKLAR